MDQFQKSGKGSLAVAVIENGTMANTSVIRGVVSDITDKVKQVPIEGPAIIVIGRVVECAAIIESVIASTVNQ
jgi:siroheme synthase